MADTLRSHAEEANGRQPRPSSGPPETPELPESIGVALSGGGVRAALFSLGVLLYLVQSGLNKDVTTVTSVSGGSITNAAVAAAGDFSTMTPEQFEPVCKKLAQRLAKEGSFFLPRSGLLIKATLLAAGLILGAEDLALEWQRGQLTPRFLMPAALVLSSELLLVLLTTVVVHVVFRKQFQLKAYRGLIASGTSRKRWLPGRTRSVQLGDLAPSKIDHVICATELLSGQPMFFSRKWVYSEAFGWGQPNVTAECAVYASAAFPGAFPPLRLRTETLEMGGGACNIDCPSVLLLADGGVYNNLGNDWFQIADHLHHMPLRQDHRFDAPAQIKYQLVVNASSPPKVTRLSRIPLVRQCVVFHRTMTVLYENTVRPRLNELEREPTDRVTVIDISRSPIQLAEQPRNSAASSGEIVERASDLLEQLKQLQGLSGHYWEELVGDTSLLKTTLRCIGTQRAARLMRHGYLSAMVAFHIRFGASGVADVPDGRRFIELAQYTDGDAKRWWSPSRRLGRGRRDTNDVLSCGHIDTSDGDLSGGIKLPALTENRPAISVD